MKETSRVPELDGLRGFAILQVLLWHYFISQRISSPRSQPFGVFDILGFTWSGVDLFFVLSGFLLGNILLTQRESPDYFKAFYVRRACRIFPLYYAWTFLFFILVTLELFREGSVLRALIKNPQPLWTYAIFVQNYPMAFATDFGASWMGVSWSLAVEEQFYIFLPLLVRFVPARMFPFLLIILISSAVVLRIMTVQTQPNLILWNYVIMPQRMDSLLGGVFAAWLVQKMTVQKIREKSKWLLGLLAVLFCVVIYLVFRRFSYVGPSMSYYGFSVLAAFYAVLLLTCLYVDKGPLGALTRMKWLRDLGIIAYGVYLFHVPVNMILHGLILGQKPESLTLPGFLVTVLALVATLVGAKLSFEYFEKRFITFGHRYRY